MEAIVHLGCTWNSGICDLWIYSLVSAPEIILKEYALSGTIHESGGEWLWLPTFFLRAFG